MEVVSGSVGGTYVAVYVVRVDAVAADLGGLPDAPLHELHNILSPHVDPPLRIAIVALTQCVLWEVVEIGLILLDGAHVDVAQHDIVSFWCRRFLAQILAH